MRGSTPQAVAAWNLVLIAGICMPIFALLPWLWGLVVGVDDRWALVGRLPGEFLFFYVVLGGPLLLGGILHQMLLMKLPASVPRRTRRMSGVMMPLTLFAAWFFHGSAAALLSPELGVALVVSSLTYLLAMRV